MLFLIITLEDSVVVGPLLLVVPFVSVRSLSLSLSVLYSLCLSLLQSRVCSLLAFALLLIPSAPDLGGLMGDGHGQGHNPAAIFFAVFFFHILAR